MNFYPFHIGDYISHTSHLSDEEDLAYRRMIDLYFMTEQALNDSSTVARRIRASVQTVETIYAEFFELGDDNLWHNKRVEEEIAKFRNRQTQASKAGKASAEARLNKRSTPVQPTRTKNQNQKSIETPKKASKLGVVELPSEWKEFCSKERPELEPQKVFEAFRDYWIGVAGVEADWFATWRNWVRKESVTPTNKKVVSAGSSLMKGVTYART